MPHYRWEQWVTKHLEVVGGSAPELICRCPFKSEHARGDQHPSFNINVQKGVYICHGCKAKGRIQQLARQMGVTATPTAPSYDDVLDEVSKLRRRVLNNTEVGIKDESFLKQYPLSERGRRYWKSRGLSDATMRAWNLGYDRSKNSVTIPIRDIHGRLLGVIRRRLAREGVRYVYPKGFKISQHLWGAHEAKGHTKIAVTEGSVDALACWDAEIPAVALLGSRISAHQITLLKRVHPDEIVLMLDRDDAGKTANDLVTAAFKLDAVVSLATYKERWDGNDPASLRQWQRRAMFKNAYPITLAEVNQLTRR